MRSPVPIVSFLLLVVAAVLGLFAPLSPAKADTPSSFTPALETVFTNGHAWAKRTNVQTLEQLRAIPEIAPMTWPGGPFDQGPALEAGRGHLWCQATQLSPGHPDSLLFDAPMRGQVVMRSPDPGYYWAFVWLADGTLWLLHYDSIGLRLDLHPSS